MQMHHSYHNQSNLLIFLLPYIRKELKKYEIYLKTVTNPTFGTGS